MSPTCSCSWNISSPPLWVRCNESERVAPNIHLPDGPHLGVAFIRSFKPPVYIIPWTVDGLHDRDNFMDCPLKS